MKFGGTSLGNADKLSKVVEIIESNVANIPVIIVSAFSDNNKIQGTTSKLLEAAEHVLIPNSQRYMDLTSEIQQHHIDVANLAIENQMLKQIAIQDIKNECDKLRSFLVAAEIIDEVSPRSKDVIISTGEKLSACLLATVLKSKGIKAVYVSLDRLIETKKFSHNHLLDQDFYDYIAQKSGLLISSALNSGSIPVVTGFLGPVPGGVLNTIGRGYTDFTAALVSVGIKAQELQIWKEVDGIFSADPRKVPNAILLTSISPEEAAELTYYGAEVIHPFTMEQVIRASIPIRIKNTFNPSGNGTIIMPTDVSLSSDFFRRLPEDAQSIIRSSPARRGAR